MTSTVVSPTVQKHVLVPRISPLTRNLKCRDFVLATIKTPSIPEGIRTSNDLTSKRECIFVINPQGGNSRVLKEWRKVSPLLLESLEIVYNVRERYTEHATHAEEIAGEAVEAGAAVVVAVGGDGTLNQVVNGFFDNGRPIIGKKDGSSKTALAVLPMGTASDFARSFGWKNNDAKSVGERLIRGSRKQVDVGRVQCGHSGTNRMFINIADVHLSARAGQLAVQYKRLGSLAYAIAGLLAFQGFRNKDVRVRVDNGEWSVVKEMTTLVVANSKYFGGGMKIAPTADPFRGSLEVVIIATFTWLHFIVHLWRLFAGRHLSLRGVQSQSVSSIEVEDICVQPAPGCKPLGESEVYVEADGEYMGRLPARFEVVPGGIDLLC